MSKLIKLTPEIIEECKNEFLKELTSGKFCGKVSYNKVLSSGDEEATVYFTEIAWLKMQALVRDFDNEVAWHGIAYRLEEKGEYIVKDILVYPQEVTGATVTTDQAKYQTWLMSHDDEVFNNIRMQGHSHVNMGTHPSTVDTTLYDKILAQLTEDMFYIFMIWNKRGEHHVEIYDMRDNVMYESADVTVKLLDDGHGIESFLREAKEMVKTKITQYGYPSNLWNNYSQPVTHYQQPQQPRKGYRKNPIEGKSALENMYDYDDTIRSIYGGYYD